MPEIPIYANGLPPKAGGIPDMPLDREGRGRVQLGRLGAQARETGQQAAEAILAGRTPLKPADMYSGLARGEQRLAAGVEHLGGVMGVLAERQQELRNYIDVSRADNAMQEAYAGHLAAREALDPREWNADLDSRLKALPGTWQGNEKISPAAQQRIMERFGHFSTMRAIETQAQVTAADVQTARGIRDAALLRAEQAKDLAGVRHIYAEAETKNINKPGEAEVGVVRSELRIRSKAAHDFYTNLDTLQKSTDDPSRFDKMRELNAGAHAQGIIDETAKVNNDVEITNAWKDQMIADHAASNPRDGLAWLARPEKERPEYLRGLGPAGEVKAEGKFYSLLFGQQNDILALGNQDIESGKIKSVQELKTWLTANDKKRLLSQSQIDLMTRKVTGDAPTQEAYNADDTELRKINWATEPPYRLPAEIARINATYSGPFREKLIKTVNDSFEQATGGAGPDPVLNMMNDTIRQRHAEGRLGVEWKDSDARAKHLLEAFKDVEKLKAVGVPDAFIPILSGKDASGKPSGKALEGPLAIKVFRTAMAKAASDAEKTGEGVPKVDPEQYNKLTDYTKRLFTEAATAGGFTDENLREKSAALEAQYKAKAAQWRIENPNATAEEARIYLSKLTHQPIDPATTPSVHPNDPNNGNPSILPPLTGEDLRREVDSILGPKPKR